MANHKLTACIAYIVQQERPEHSTLDAVKLNKVLWYSDAASFMDNRVSITGSRYIRKPRGPVAKGMPSAIIALERKNVLTVGKRYDESVGAWLETFDFIGGTDSSSDEFDGDEDDSEELTQDDKARLSAAHKRVCLESDSDSISERTHGEIWSLASDSEEIPLYAVYAERLGKITKEHVLAANAA